VLSRRSIRTKLTIVLGLMMAVVLILASSAFWGLYRYRWLANGISHRAQEIPYANKLSQSAETIRDAGHRLRRLRQENQMLEPHTLSLFGASRIDFETGCFEDALSEFERSLDAYMQLIGQSDAEQSLFVDPQQRQDILVDIRAQLERVKESHSCPVIQRDEASFEALQRELDLLANQTTELTGMMHQGMAAYSTDVRNEYRTGIAIAWSCLIAASSMVCLLLLLFRSLVIKPFRTLLDGSRLVAAGQFDHRIDLGTGDELSELATVMNQMTTRFQRTCGMLERERADLDKQVRDRSREVIQREQLASVGFLAAGVAHEINNPLASIAWSAEALESRLHDVIHGEGPIRTIPADEAKVLGENLRRVQDEAYRCKGITQRLLDFSRLGDVERSQVDIGDLVRDVVAMVGTLGKYKCKTLRTHCDGVITAHVNGQQIRQVALNLITNALESVDTDGAVDVTVQRDGAMVRVTVQDNGCGMSDEVLEHLFEPFFTRRRDGSGTGLGLSITHRIVTQHGGQLTACSDGPGRGSRLQFEVPAERPTPGVNHLASHQHKEGLYEPLRVA
jgi:two-component system NtrC family sensor kinase